MVDYIQVAWFLAFKGQTRMPPRPSQINGVQLLQRLLFILGLFVVVSWISFVVPPDVIPGRMALLVTLFLVLVNIFNSVTTNTPKAEGKYWK